MGSWESTVTRYSSESFLHRRDLSTLTADRTIRCLRDGAQGELLHASFLFRVPLHCGTSCTVTVAVRCKHAETVGVSCLFIFHHFSFLSVLGTGEEYACLLGGDCRQKRPGCSDLRAVGRFSVLRMRSNDEK